MKQVYANNCIDVGKDRKAGLRKRNNGINKKLRKRSFKYMHFSHEAIEIYFFEPCSSETVSL
jgi:hypothetical protein